MTCVSSVPTRLPELEIRRCGVVSYRRGLEVQQALVENHQRLGNQDAAIRHAGYAHLLATGGVVDASEEGEE